MRGLHSIFSFSQLFYVLKNTKAGSLDSVYQMTLKLLFNFDERMLRLCHICTY